MSALLTAMAEDRWWCYWLVAFLLGFRRSEGLGMRWQDLDLERRVWTPGMQVQRLRGDVDPATGKRIWPGTEINCRCYSTPILKLTP